MSARRRLVVNADDLGLSPGVNRGIIEAHEKGIVTSASLMVRWPAACEAAAYAREHLRLGVGLHVDLGEWAYRGGEWETVYQVVPVADADAVGKEVEHQLAAFRDLVGRDPTHLDSHQHVHREQPVRSILMELAGQLDIPLRHFTPSVHYCGRFYGQTTEGEPVPGAIRADRLIEIVSALPPGITELACHPGYAEDLNTMYRDERRREVDALCDARVRAALVKLGVRLVSFADLFADGLQGWT